MLSLASSFKGSPWASRISWNFHNSQRKLSVPSISGGRRVHLLELKNVIPPSWPENIAGNIFFFHSQRKMITWWPSSSPQDWCSGNIAPNRSPLHAANSDVFVRARKLQTPEAFFSIFVFSMIMQDVAFHNGEKGRRRNQRTWQLAKMYHFHPICSFSSNLLNYCWNIGKGTTDTMVEYFHQSSGFKFVLQFD